MKTKITFSLLFTLIMSVMSAQRTYVTANSADISDQLDLRAVATLFGESMNLQEFERNLNDPEIQISNLDLNGDNFVDYLRVIEHNDRNTHLIIIQAVLESDVFQDVATIEVENNRRRRHAQVQIVGNPYIYGNNFIIEPHFAYTPVIYNHFWQPIYNVYVSPWRWGYYPTFFNAWHPCDMHFYYGHVNYWAGYHQFNYVSYRRFNRAMRLYNRNYNNTYATLHPSRAFDRRHQNVRNAHALHQSRGDRDFRQIASRETSNIRGVERITSNRTENSGREVNTNGRQTNGRESTSGREVNTNGRETNGRETNAGREINTNGRQTVGRQTVGRESTSGREVNTNGRETGGRTTNISRESTPQSPSRADSEPIRVERQAPARPSSNRTETRPARTTEVKPANNNRATSPSRASEAPSRSNERSSTSTPSRSTSERAGRG
jgi:hypothetical protein